MTDTTREDRERGGEAPDDIRLTCHNGHTSSLRELRDEADCSAPCCPRCGECSFTFEPSEGLRAPDARQGEHHAAD